MLNKFDVLKIFSLAKIESLSVCNVLMTFIFIPIQLLLLYYQERRVVMRIRNADLHTLMTFINIINERNLNAIKY